MENLVLCSLHLRYYTSAGCITHVQLQIKYCLLVILPATKLFNCKFVEVCESVGCLGEMKGGDHSGDLEVDVRIMDLEEIGWTGFI